MACGILALNCESYLALKLVLDSRVLALVLVSRVQASTSALTLKGPGLGLGLGLEGPGLGLSLGLVLGLWILALTTTLVLRWVTTREDRAMWAGVHLYLRPTVYTAVSCKYGRKMNQSKTDHWSLDTDPIYDHTLNNKTYPTRWKMAYGQQVALVYQH